MGRPRDPKKHAQWQRRMAKFRKSSMTVPEFCEAERVTESSFYWWQRQLGGGRARSGGATTAAGTSAGKAADRSAGGADAGGAVLTIRLPTGVSLEMPLADLDAVRAVVEQVVRGEQLPRRQAYPRK